MGRKTLFIVTTAVTQPQAKNSLADRIVLLILSLPPHDTVVTAAPYRAEGGKVSAARSGTAIVNRFRPKISKSK